MGSFGRALGGINLPGTGVVREIGNEFAMATKQVLLFGTAYKALAFLTSFPAQVGQAVGALQSFNNTLKAISPTAEEAKASNQFILDIVNRYNVPLQSARDGFTKLYASMAPAGFKGDEIRELFTGVSQAAATFGMSADKVDRVNYAFAQMASKGQVMSEELKGQLGDVLPGAMGIFTEAAGFEGPDAIQKFSKALEDGAYQGEAMRVLLKNVSVVLTKEFGPGAEGAARTFQGVINRMQNSTKLLYEAFEPVAVGFLNAVVVPLTSGIKTMADGFTAFFKGVKAETSGGFAIAQQLEKLRPAFDGIRANVVNLLPVFQSFGNTLLQVSTILLQIAGNPITGYLAKIYAIALPLNMVLNTMRGLWAANALQLLIFNTRVASGTSTLTAFRGMMAATGASAATTATAIRGAGLTLRTFFATTGIGLVVAGISILIERFMSMNQALEETRNKAVGAAQAIRSMTATEARAEEQRSTRAIKLLETLQTRKRTYEGSTDVPLSDSEASLLEGMGIPVGKGLGGGRYLDPTRLEGYKQRVQTTNLAEAQARQRQVQFEEKQAMTPVELAPIEETAKEGKAKKLDTYNRSQLDFIKQNAEQEKLALDRRLQQGIVSKTQYELSMAELELATKKLELAEQLRLSGLQINKDNLSAQDKQLKLADAQISYQNELNIAQDKYTVAVEGAKKELEGPLNDALQKTTRAMEEQQMLLDNLRIGLGELTPDQQAYLQTQELIVGRSEDEIEIMKNKLASLRRVFEQQILLNKEVEKERKTRELLQSIEMAGALTPDAELRQKLSQEGYTGADLEVRFGLEKTLERAQTLKEQIQGIASSIGDSFGQAFKGIITGSSSVQEALSGMFRSIADSFADMVSQMIASWLRTQVLQGFQSLFGPAMGALGSFGGGASIGQAVSMPTGVGMGAGGGILQNSTGQGFGTFGPNFGIRQFANGGVVSGPTLGLVGEGRYNEAVVPLPDGKSIPVSLGGASGSNISTNIVVNMGNGQGGGGQATGAQGNQLARELEGAVRQVILKESRPGGIIYSR
jgi:tape measure domain-containing protein